MIRIAQETPDSKELLVFDVRPESIALETNREAKVYLGKIIPVEESKHPERGYQMYKWESRWGLNAGQAPSIDRCRHWIEVCAKGNYK